MKDAIGDFFWRERYFSYCIALSSGKRCSSQLEQFSPPEEFKLQRAFVWLNTYLCFCFLLRSLGEVMGFVVVFVSFVGFWGFFKLQSLTCNSSYGNASNIIMVKIINTKSNDISSFSKSCFLIYIYAGYSMNNKTESICINLHWCSLTSSVARKYRSLWTAWKQFLQSACILLS